jgi:hypothetical protein
MVSHLKPINIFWEDTNELTSLLTEVREEALKGNIPPSWKRTRMVLLFKKGDSTLLKNWIPLSQINTDAKIFTKMIANQLNLVFLQLINPFQTGFIGGQLISDNGRLNHLLMEDHGNLVAGEPSVTVVLDAEKVYDRVHPLYLQKVLQIFGLPTQLITGLFTLFPNSTHCIN